jgi:uncharacterized repeat protein (TIGR01451 family)
MKSSEKQTRRDSRLFSDLAAGFLRAGIPIRFRADGASMRPTLEGGDLLTVEPIDQAPLQRGNIVLTCSDDGFKAHRIVTLNETGDAFEIRGDAGLENESGDSRMILGRVTQAESSGRCERLDTRASRFQATVRQLSARLRTAASLRLRRIISLALFSLTVIAWLLLGAAPAAAQADLSLTQSASPTVVAPGGTITYTEVVTNLGPNAAVTAVLYQETPPNTTFASITPPTGWTCGTVPAVGGTGQVICTDGANFAINSPVTFTFVVAVAGTTAAGTTILNSADVTSTTQDPVQSNSATTTSVLVETTGQADLAATITASPTPVFVSSTLTYTIQIQNLGLVSTTNGTLTDNLPTGANGVTFVSATSTQGSCVNSAGTVTCTLGAIAYPPTPITVTITVTTPLTATTLTNTASVSSTTTDPVSGNNSATAITVVQPLVCATPGKDGAGTAITGVVNAYYPPASSVGTLAAGSTSVALGTAAANGAQTDIAVGDLLLFIQMQDATINATNSSSYGHGVPGEPASGWTLLKSSGMFEFVTAASAVTHGAGGTLTFTGTGSGGGLLNTYNNGIASASQGQQTFQVIRVPQYTSVTLGAALTAMAWNGATGGVLAVDVASQLTLNGATVTTDALGFRGGGGRMLTGGTGAATDYLTLSTDATNGSKGEGIAGTPHYLANAAITALITTAQTYAEGLPNGSYSRGAPGNAGGGATDADPAANDQNSGGGGGGNGGAGGNGGFGWSSAGIVGGFGGAAFPVSTSALVMGGGAGAGTTNNGTADPTNTNPAGINSSGAAGGAIVIIHAGSMTGTGTITANGQTALNVMNDGGGGGGAGGSIRVLANSGGLGGLTLAANGGKGGNTWATNAPGTSFPGNRHGPGGGGGGGAIILSGTPASSSVTGGLPGYSTTAQDAYGATQGQAGVVATGLTVTQTPGTQPGAYCASADLAVTNVGAPNPVAAGNNITYTQTVTNNGPFDAVNGVFSGAIPLNTTFVSMSAAAGWTCGTLPSVGGTGNIQCTNPDVGNGSTGTFTLVVTVGAGTAFGTQIVDVASVASGTKGSGTNDPNLSNNTAIALNVVGTATSANLADSMSASPSPVVQAGNNITYTIVVQNLGPAASSGVTFSDPIPANATFVSATTPAGWSACAPSSGTISCSVASMAYNATATFTVVLNVPSGTASGTIITNQVTVTGTTPDPNPANNTAQVSDTVATAGQADLSVTSVASPSTVLSGSNISYAQTVTNNGPSSMTNVTFTDSVPTNTTLVSLGIPAGWTCPTIPAVGSAGSISCCPGSGGVCSGTAVTSGTTVNFPLVIKVTAGTAPGTDISDTASVGPTASDPNTGNNSVTTNVYVASPTQADVAILKTASPEPVDQTTNLTYTLQVKNNGPAVAQGVSVTDPIPGEVTYVSASSSQGTCSYAATTVTCSIGTLSVGGVAIITINVTAGTFSSTTQSSNTATVTATTSDPNPSNNSSTALTTIQSPTAVQIASMRAMTRQGGGVVLEWRTREEVRNLGFFVFREDAQGRHQLNASLIAGSALFMRGGSSPHHAKTYQWLDPQGGEQSVYWIVDVDLNGTRTPHGPVSPDSVYTGTAPVSQSPLLSQLNTMAAQALAHAPSAALTPRTIATPRPEIPALAPGEYRVSLEALPAVKISVRNEGWYLVSQAQLVAAGLDPRADARMLQLYAEGIEQPIRINGNQAGPLGANDSIEFYGTGIDTPFSDTRVYWLVSGWKPGKRIPQTTPANSGSDSTQSFPFTVVLEQRTTYFAALLNGENADNYFGALVSSEPVDQNLTVAHNDPNSSIPVTLDVTLQGAVDGQDHVVQVALNGTTLGEMSFSGLANSASTFPVQPALLQEGTDTVTLTALEGDNDLSLVQTIALHYAHSYTADSDWLRATAPAGAKVHITGFTNPQVRVFDITNPLEIIQVVGAVAFDGTSYGVSIVAPGWKSGDRTLLAFSSDQVSPPAAVSFHSPSSLAEQKSGADIVIITHSDFAASLAPLVNLHRSQGHEVALVTVDQLFDAFNYGERSPFALRDYLQFAATNWRDRPEAVLLAGDASVDPRNYLGFGDFDFVPTRIIETAAFKTASDDWFTDFQQNGFATIPTGRLPVRTAADASLVVSKIVNYEKRSSLGSWAQQALFIADQNIGVNFTAETKTDVTLLPSSLAVTEILADGQDPGVVTQQILAALNNGALLVNYTGHGSEEQWSFSDLFDDTSASQLKNGDRLPVFLIMDCLNGFFDDVYGTSLATSLLLAPNGGGVAVWASSGFTNAPPQAAMDYALLQIMAANPSLPIGQAILRAKSGVGDPDVRRTWILFGDPSMRVAFPPVVPPPKGRPQR